jgi:hypothetical protein
LLELYKRNTFFSLLLLLPYALGLHLGPGFVVLPIETSDHNWMYNSMIQPWLPSGLYEWAFASGFIFVQAVAIAKLISDFRLNPAGELFPSLFFMLFCGTHQQTLAFGAIHLANFFFVLSLFQLFRCYQKKRAVQQLFNFGFLIGVASLFYPPYCAFLFLGLAGLFVLRAYKTREWLQMLGGFCSVYLLAFAALYVANLHVEFFNKQIAAHFSPYIFSMEISSKGWIAFGIIVFAVLVSLLHYGFFQVKRNIAQQKYYDLFFWCLLAAFLSILFQRIDNPGHLVLIITPLSVLCGLLLTRVKNPLVAETTHLFLVAISLFLQFQNW